MPDPLDTPLNTALSSVQIAALLVLVLYLLAFFGGTALAARAAGRPVWLFGQARGLDRLAAMGFRASFALGLLAPLIWALVPGLARLDPLWSPGLSGLALPGVMLSVAGAMLGFAAQMAMGASWRVGVSEGAVGALVSGGLYTISRNPTFVGQGALLAGVACAVPSLPGILAVLLFFIAASVQIRTEEAFLARTHGAEFAAFARRTPRWLGWPHS